MCEGMQCVLTQVISSFIGSIELNPHFNLFAVSEWTQRMTFYDYYAVTSTTAGLPSPVLTAEYPSRLWSVNRVVCVYVCVYQLMFPCPYSSLS